MDKGLLQAFVVGVWLATVVAGCAAPDTPAVPTRGVQPPVGYTPWPESTPVVGVETNAGDYAEGQIPQYGKFEVSFPLPDIAASNPYFPYEEDTPPGVEPATGITVDALFLPPGETDWQGAKRLPCFYYQPVEEVSEGDHVALLPVGGAEWRCRFAPETPGRWTYKIRAIDAGGPRESSEHQFTCAQSDNPGFVRVSQADPRFFELSDGTPFVTPLVNSGGAYTTNDLARLRRNIRYLGENGVRFVRWFPTGEFGNPLVAPYGGDMRIAWRFGAWVTDRDADVEAGKSQSFVPYYYSAQAIPLVPGSRYRLRFRAKVTGEQVLRAEVGSLPGGSVDICSSSSAHHESVGNTCTYKRDSWADYAVEVETTGPAPALADIALRGLYFSRDAPAPYNVPQDGSIGIHSVQLERDETGRGGWGPNLLTRSDPDTHRYVDQRAAAMLDEILRLSEQYGVYHKLTLFHKEDAVLARLQPDGTFGERDVNNFYSAKGEASRWYQEAYVRYFVARWSYSTALHSLELANENNFDAKAQAAAFDIAEHVLRLSPRHILMSNSFWGWWVDDFWTDPTRGHLMDYSDKHWYANPEGASCDAEGKNCELISNVWTDSAAYVRECWRRFRAYSEYFEYDKPIVRGEGGVAQVDTQPQHPAIATEPTGTYYHKKLWAHVGVLGYTCDGEWYSRLFVPRGDDTFPNSEHDLGKMFAAYERFVAGEPLANGGYVEIGTDLSGLEQITLTDAVGRLRAWGVRDGGSGRALLWIDNADHTWWNVVERVPVAAASATISIPGLQAGTVYRVEWWDPYAGISADPILGVESVVAQGNGSLALRVQELARDVAVKIMPGGE
jgi:hypothetical protein